MKVRTEDIHDLQQLVSARNSLMWSIAQYKGGYIQLSETDSKGSTPLVPPELGIEVLGTALGLVNARLIAKGVTVAEISETSCLECGGSGTDSRDREGT